jgi:hypothetical protein
VAQCEGKTRKGERCKRDAGAGGAFCSIHVDQEVRPRSEPSGEWDRDAITKAAIGFALIGAVFLFRFRR